MPVQHGSEGKRGACSLLLPKCCPGTGSMGISRELVRNAASQATPRPWLRICMFTGSRVVQSLKLFKPRFPHEWNRVGKAYLAGPFMLKPNNLCRDLVLKFLFSLTSPFQVSVYVQTPLACDWQLESKKGHLVPHLLQVQRKSLRPKGNRWLVADMSLNLGLFRLCFSGS